MTMELSDMVGQVEAEFVRTLRELVPGVLYPADVPPDVTPGEPYVDMRVGSNPDPETFVRRYAGKGGESLAYVCFRRGFVAIAKLEGSAFRWEDDEVLRVVARGW